MQVRKLGVKNLVVGNIYVAYSSKNKLLSKNDGKGVLVKVVTAEGVNIKVQPLGTDTVTAIAKLEGRDDAWIYEVAGADLEVQARIANKKAFPGFSPRMEREGWDGKVFTFNPDDLYALTEEDGVADQVGTLTLRHEGDTIDPEEDAPYVNIFLASNIYPAKEPEWRVPRAQRMGVGAVEINLPPKRVSAEEEAVIALLSDALATVKEHPQTNTACYIICDAKGKSVYKDLTGACHAGLRREDNAKGAAYIVTGCKKIVEPMTDNIQREFINYLTNHSPFKDAFIIKDADWIMKERAYVLDCTKVSAQLIGGACIATRQCWEYPHLQVAWYNLMEQGLDMNTSYVFGCKATFSSGKWRFAQSHTGHTVFNLDGMTEKAIINFIDGKPTIQNKQPFSKDCNYWGVCKMWGGEDEQAGILTKLGKLSAGATAWGGDSAYMTADDAFEKAADLIEDWAKGAGV